jgi:hypothetical protein
MVTQERLRLRILIHLTPRIVCTAISRLPLSIISHNFVGTSINCARQNFREHRHHASDRMSSTRAGEFAWCLLDGLSVGAIGRN